MLGVGGDDRSGEKLVGRYLGVLTRFFHNKVNDPEDAAELISDTMLACVKNKENVKDIEAFRLFLFAAAMNILRRYYRKKVKRKRELDDFEDICVGDADGSRSLTSNLRLKQETRLLVRALRRVPLDQQIVLELNHVEDLNGTQIAELLGVPPQTVYTRLRRGKERLKVVMTELAESPELVESTMMGLQTWAGMVREEMGR
ncbi:MAG: sigma-70 family RNA polymerase sigma factor [Deltaproteobacteria bacterium]|nr:sigma-70 family RNA polymerase sigma factor [Deltaproteobacteria bacterium]